MQDYKRSIQTILQSYQTQGDWKLNNSNHRRKQENKFNDQHGNTTRTENWHQEASVNHTMDNATQGFKKKKKPSSSTKGLSLNRSIHIPSINSNVHLLQDERSNQRRQVYQIQPYQIQWKLKYYNQRNTPRKKNS